MNNRRRHIVSAAASAANSRVPDNENAADEMPVRITEIVQCQNAAPKNAKW